MMSCQTSKPISGPQIGHVVAPRVGGPGRRHLGSWSSESFVCERDFPTHSIKKKKKKAWMWLVNNYEIQSVAIILNNNISALILCVKL